MINLFLLFLSLVFCASDKVEDLELHQLLPDDMYDVFFPEGEVPFDVRVVAFVNSANSPMSFQFHPILHELNKIYFLREKLQQRPRVAISYADLKYHRKFSQTFGIKQVPTVLAFFPKILKGSATQLPVEIIYTTNRTISDYRREIDSLSSLVSGFDLTSRRSVPLRSPVNRGITDFFNGLKNHTISGLLQQPNVDYKIYEDGTTDSEYPKALIYVKEDGVKEDYDVEENPILSDFLEEVKMAKYLSTIYDAKLGFISELMKEVIYEGEPAILKAINYRKARLVHGRDIMETEERNSILIELGVLWELANLLSWDI